MPMPRLCGSQDHTSVNPLDLGPISAPTLVLAPLKYCVTFAWVILRCCQLFSFGALPTGTGIGVGPRLRMSKAIAHAPFLVVMRHPDRDKSPSSAAGAFILALVGTGLRLLGYPLGRSTGLGAATLGWFAFRAWTITLPTSRDDGYVTPATCEHLFANRSPSDLVF